MIRADAACQHINASLIDLEVSLRENVIITCTGRKCTWKQRKRTHEGMKQALDMDFTKPTLNKLKKKRLKPRCDTYDPRTSYDAHVNLAENFRKLLAETVPSAVLLHLLPDWFKYRTGRIIASHCKRIASLKSTTAPTKALKEALSFNQVPLSAVMKEGWKRRMKLNRHY